MQCLILAGGLATRMRPLTAETPKSLLLVHGRPFIEYQLEWLKENGVKRVVLAIGYLGDRIVQHVGDGARFDVEVTYVDEGTTLRGTGGAVRHAYDKQSLEDPFLLLQGDSFLPIEIPPVWKSFERSGKLGLMTVYRNERKWEESNVIFENGTVVNYHKGVGNDPRFQFVDYGLMIFTHAFVEKYLGKEFPLDLAGPLHTLSLEGNLAGFEVNKRFYEIGSREGLDQFTEFVSHGHS